MPEAKPTPAAPGLRVGSLPSKPSSAPREIETLQDLATRLLHHADDAGCIKGDCSILVMNFVLPDGNTSRYGMQVADQLSSEMAKQEKSVQVIDRALLQNLLQRDRIPARLQSSEPVARWMGKGLNATVVLVGTTKRIGKNVVQVSARFLSVKDENRIGPSAEVNVAVDDVVVDLYPTNGLPNLQPITVTPSGENLRRAGVSSVSMPSCFYMPNPPYTEEARKGKFSGAILVEGIIDIDGTMKGTRIVMGAPYGLNASALSSMATWKCRAATYEGKPVPVLISFEVNFRLH